MSVWTPERPASSKLTPGAKSCPKEGPAQRPAKMIRSPFAGVGGGNPINTNKAFFAKAPALALALHLLIPGDCAVPTGNPFGHSVTHTAASWWRLKNDDRVHVQGPCVR